MTVEQENRLRLLASAKERAWQHYQNLGVMDSSRGDALQRELAAVEYSMARARYVEAAAAFDRAVHEIAA